MRHICFFNSIKFWGGGEKLHLENALEFEKLDYDVILLAQENAPLWQKAQSKGLKTYAMTVGNLSFLNPIKLVKLIRFYKLRKTDTVLFSSSQDLKLGSIAAHIAGVERIVYLRGLAAPIKNSVVNRWIFQKVLTHIIPNSTETKNQMLKHLGQYVNMERVKVIYHGIEVEPALSNGTVVIEEIRKKGKGVILGNAGRLTKQKGQDKLIEVAKSLDEKGVDFTLFIAGTGELQTDLEALIAKYNLQEKVFLLGYVEDMKAFMESIDIFLLSSIWEGFGFVLVEAMIQSKPIVAFDITSNPEIVKANKTGFLIDYPNLLDFTDKTLQLIEDNELRQSMGQAGAERVIKNFILKDKVLEIESFLRTTSHSL